MPGEGVDFDKILALLPLKMLMFLQFIPAKQGFHSSIVCFTLLGPLLNLIGTNWERFQSMSCDYG